MVFEPNKRAKEPSDEGTALAGFYARTASGETITTRTHPLIGYQGRTNTDTEGQLGRLLTVVLQASTVTVSESGVASIQLLGLGETPDYSIVINPRHSQASHLVSFNKDGSRDQYRLGFPPHDNSSESWVVAYADRLEEQWRPLRHAIQ